MIIELIGGGVRNLGAFLMVKSVEEHFQHDPAVHLVLSPDGHEQAPRARGRLRFLERPLPSGGRTFVFRFRANRMLSTFLSREELASRGLVKAGGGHALFDISGVRFADHVSPIAMKKLVFLARHYRKLDRPVVLLPQMFGPMEREETRRWFTQMVALSSLVYARDSTSLQFARSVVGHASNLRLAPDITLVTQGAATAPGTVLARDKGYGCLVPNSRVLQWGDHRWKHSYVDRLVQATNLLDGAGVQPVFVVHSSETGGDAELAFEARELSDVSDCQVLQLEDPLEAKALLGGSRVVVASRFHSAASALSSHVPTVVIGWAHKYDALATDFGVPELIHKATDTKEDFEALISRLLDPQMSLKYSERIRGFHRQLETANREMWGEVDRLLERVD